MNSSTFEYELQEDYMQEQAEVAPIRSVSEAGRDEVLSILQCLYILPRKNPLCPSSPTEVKVESGSDGMSASEELVTGDDASIICLEDVSVDTINELLMPIMIKKDSHSFESSQPRLKLGRNDMLQPKASTRMKQLINSDPLALSTLFKIDAIIADGLDLQSQLSVYMFFDVLENFAKYSPSIIQVSTILIDVVLCCVVSFS